MMWWRRILGVLAMDQQGQMFVPDTLLVRTGQPVHFRTSEDVLHNVRVVRSDKTPIFNVATPPFGSYTHTFDQPGFYNVTCDIHATMRATVYVASTPYIGTADEHGRFTFEHVVPGRYTAAGFADREDRRRRRSARRAQPPLDSRLSFACPFRIAT
jgi:hypothetical protein